MRRGLLITALAVYLAVTLGCMFASSGDPVIPRNEHPFIRAERAAGLPFRSVSRTLTGVLVGRAISLTPSPASMQLPR